MLVFRVFYDRLLAHTLTNPPVFSASCVNERPLAASGNLPIMTGWPAAFASSGDSPTPTISGSVNTIAGTATGS